MARTTTALVAGFVVLLLARCAFADHPRAATLPPHTEPSTETVRYGWQTLLADAASLSLMLAVGANGLAWTAQVFAMNAPVVHLLHQNWVGGAVSFAIRAPVPLLFQAVGGGAGGAAVLILVVPLIAGAAVVDAAVFARDERPVSPVAGMPVAPIVAFDREAALFGLQGRL